jgi:transketolase C-terminal domain/subunit
MGIDVGLINKPTLNLPDPVAIDRIGATHFVLVVEGQNRQTGLGSRFGSWLLDAGHSPSYDYMGVVRPGNGGIPEHIPYQGLAPEDILKKIKELAV